MDSLETAIQLAKKAHAGQKDKAGKPYFSHLERVAASVHGNDEKIVAYLHDILEDTPTTEEDLRDIGFSEKIVNAVKILTKHTANISFPDPYFNKVKSNPLARKVKLADLSDNMDVKRFCNPTDRDHVRCEKYKKIYDYLKN